MTRQQALRSCDATGYAAQYSQGKITGVKRRKMFINLAHDEIASLEISQH
ncbi:hypothetical protein [uncultured Campylobacter sp.]|nr:hypothetical protein [uncultured Campylobacter sp.]